MTACPTQLTFDFLRRKAIVADFDGGLISSDAGLLPIRQLDHRLGWTAAVAEILDDHRQGGKVEHVLPAVVRQRLFGLLAGYADANDHTRLRHDAILQTVGRQRGQAPWQPADPQPIRERRRRPTGRSDQPPAGGDVHPTHGGT